MSLMTTHIHSSRPTFLTLFIPSSTLCQGIKKSTLLCGLAIIFHASYLRGHWQGFMPFVLRECLQVNEFLPSLVKHPQNEKLTLSPDSFTYDFYQTFREEMKNTNSTLNLPDN